MCCGSSVEEPIAATASGVLDGHAIERRVEAGRQGTRGTRVVVGVHGRSRSRERRHGLRRTDAWPGTEDARAPGVHRPGLDDTMPRVVGRGPRWWRCAGVHVLSTRWDALTGRVVLAVAAVRSLALLAAIVGTVVGAR